MRAHAPESARPDAPDGPLVSIVVPTFNGAPWLREALDSMLAQTWRKLEVIVVDDASTDETASLLQEYVGRIQVVRHPVNRGIYDAVNTGIACARGQLIATYHADDVYLPEMVEAQVAYLREHPEVGAVFASDIFVDADGGEYGRIELPPEVRGERPLGYALVLNTLMRYKNRFLVCPTAMVRASVYASVGLYRQDRYLNTSDLEMWLRIARSYPLAVLETHLMKYRHFHGNSSQRYHRLRTTPENFFWIMDEYLAAGGRRRATRESLAAFEAHRAEDRLMATVSHYVLGDLPAGREALRRAGVTRLARSPNVQRGRLLLLAAGLWVALRLPRQEWLARGMVARWHEKKAPKRARLPWS